MPQRQNHNGLATAAAEINLRLDQAVKAGSFMVAVWIVESDGTVLCHRTTFEFPTDQMIPAADLLRDNVRQEVVADQSPLPPADFGLDDEDYVPEPSTGTTGDGSPRTTTTSGNRKWAF